MEHHTCSHSEYITNAVTTPHVAPQCMCMTIHALTKKNGSVASRPYYVLQFLQKCKMTSFVWLSYSEAVIFQDQVHPQ